MIRKFQNDKGFLVGMVLFDLQTTFDTADHYFPVMKLEDIGLSVDILNWFKSYLSNRCNQVFSQTKSIVTYGVPQGSILDSLLSLMKTLYVNGVCAVIEKKCYMQMTQIFFVVVKTLVL